MDVYLDDERHDRVRGLIDRRITALFIKSESAVAGGILDESVSDCPKRRYLKSVL